MLEDPRRLGRTFACSASFHALAEGIGGPEHAIIAAGPPRSPEQSTNQSNLADNRTEIELAPTMLLFVVVSRAAAVDEK